MEKPAVRIRHAAVAAKKRQRIPAVAVGIKPVKKIAAALMAVVLTEPIRRDAAQIVNRDAASIGKGVYQA